MNKGDSKDRFDDFTRRASYTPDSVYHHQKRRWAYIPVHPFADEPEDLRRLGITPDDCWGVDAYWHAETDIYFLQVWTNRQEALSGDSRLFVRWSEGELALLNLVARVSDQNVTRSKFEALMERFYELIRAEPERFGPVLGSSLILLAAENGS